jgi:hypothetical protein
LFADGRVFSARAAQKIRTGEQGWRYSAQLLIDAGAPAPDGDTRGWLRTWLPRVTRAIRHPGNHRYAWALDRGRRGQPPNSLPYPKLTGLFRPGRQPGHEEDRS